MVLHIVIILNLFILSDSSNILYNQAVDLYHKNELQQSEKIFKKIYSSKDSNFQAKLYFYLGNINFKNERFIEAIDCYKNVLRKESAFYEAKYNLVLARKKLNQNNQKQTINTADYDNLKQQQINEILNEARQLENQAVKKVKGNTITPEIKRNKNW